MGFFFKSAEERVRDARTLFNDNYTKILKLLTDAETGTPTKDELKILKARKLLDEVELKVTDAFISLTKNTSNIDVAALKEIQDMHEAIKTLRRAMDAEQDRDLMNILNQMH